MTTGFNNECSTCINRNKCKNKGAPTLFGCPSYATEYTWDKEEVWDAIHELSDIRAKYNLFNPKQRPKYHACSLAIKALREVIDEPLEGYKMTHYVVVFDWAVDGIGTYGTEIIAVTHTLEEAKEIFAKSIIEEKQFAIEHGRTIYVDTDTEFNSGENGNYNAEHAHFYIEEVR